MAVGRGLDWIGLLRIGLGELRLRPREFWAMTPAEFALMSGHDVCTGASGGPMTRTTLATLAERYPDLGEFGDDR